MIRRFPISLRALLIANLIGCWACFPGRGFGEVRKPRATIAGGNASWAPVFSPDGKKLVECSMSAAGDFTEFWDVKTGQRLRRIEHPNPHAAGSSTFHRVAFSADSKRIAIDLFRAIEIWDVATMTRVASVDAQPLSIDALLLSPDGSVLAGLQHGATGTHGHRTSTQVCCWDLLTGDVILSHKPVPDQFTQMAFSADGKSLLTVTAREIKHWSLRTGEADSTVALRNDGATTEEFAHLAFTADYKHLVSVQSYDDRFTRNTRRCLWRVSLWDVVTGEPLVKFPGRRSDRVGPALLSPNAKTLAIGGETGILLYGFNGYSDTSKTRGGDAAEPLALKSRGGQVWSLAFSPDGKTLGSTWARDSNIWLWDVETGRNIHTLKRQGYSTRVAFSPDGETLAAKDEHHVVKLWNWPLDSSK